MTTKSRLLFTEGCLLLTAFCSLPLFKGSPDREVIGIVSSCIYLVGGNLKVRISQYIVDTERKIREVIGAPESATCFLKAIHQDPILELLVEVGKSSVVKVPTYHNRIGAAVGMGIEKLYLCLLNGKPAR